MRYVVVLLVGAVSGYLLAGLVPMSAPEKPVIDAVSEQKPVENPPVSPFTPVQDDEALSVSARSVQEVSDVSGPTTSAHTEDVAVAAQPIELTNLGSIRHYSNLAAFFENLGSADTDQLSQLAAQLRSGFQYNYSNQYYNTLGSAVYQRWADVDFDAALDSVADITAAQYGPDTGFYMNTLQVLANARPGLMQEWMEQQNRQVREMVQHTVYAGMAEDDPELLASQALQLTGRDGEEMLHMAMSEWARKDPAAAWRFIQVNDDSDALSNAFHTIFRTWIDTDATAALATLEGLTADSGNETAIAEGYAELYVSALARTDPQAALDYLSLQATTEQLYAGQSAIYDIARQQPELLLSWLEQLPAEQEDLWSMAYMPLVEAQSMNDPEAAMAMLDKIPQARNTGMDFMILDQWIMNDLDGAVSWLHGRPDTAENRQLLLRSIDSLLYSEPDPVAKLSLIEQLVPVVDESTAQRVVYMVGVENPQLARDWLSRNTDANTFALASITIDALDLSIPTSQLLQQFDSLDGILQPYLLMDLLQTRQHDVEEISLWLDTTAVLQNEDRQQLKMMFNIGDANSARYYRAEPELIRPQNGQ